MSARSTEQFKKILLKCDCSWPWNYLKNITLYHERIGGRILEYSFTDCKVKSSETATNQKRTSSNVGQTVFSRNFFTVKALYTASR